ncbi:MAG: lytic transglycosylase domain-containing protein [Sulfurovum sp.]|nr:lytic transglycosylase domain-containing protein [Sulfurovum sp.]
MKNPLLLPLILCLAMAWLPAKSLSYTQVHQMPLSIEKDYYIWRLLQQASTSKAEARHIIKEATGPNKKLKDAYKKKTGSTVAIPKIKMTSTLYNTNWRNRVKAHKHFKHGLSLLQQGKATQASGYFYLARHAYAKRYDVDKSLFWLYLSTKEQRYIKELRKSIDSNIYTLIAADAMNGRYPKTISKIIKKAKTQNFNIKDPIAWAKVKHKMNTGHDLHDLAQAHKSQESIGIYTFLQARASHFTETYFPMPYRNVLSKMPKERQALIYAIARQESRFVPASVSRSFALGMMQFMPFLIEDVAKQKGEKIDLDRIFDPYKAIEYADFHLDYLNTYLQHPLFVAYAYNGGIGFTRRHIENNKHFRKGPYEPYMSMETMKNVEAREYGKKVLANYVIYLNKLGVVTRLFPLLQSLATPSLTDKFRK